MKSILTFIAISCICMLSGTATVISISSPGSLGVDGSINWGILGPQGTPVTSPFNINVTGVPGLSATVSRSDNYRFERLDQNGFSFNGNFGDGEELLWNYSQERMSIEFGSGVVGIGFQIQSGYYGQFTATLESFDAGNVSLGVFDFLGSSTNLGDDSAIFVGVLSDSPNIARLEIYDIGGFAINGPLVQSGNGGDGGGGVGVPDGGSTLALLGLGLSGMVTLKRFRKRYTAQHHPVLSPFDHASMKGSE